MKRLILIAATLAVSVGLSAGLAAAGHEKHKPGKPKPHPLLCFDGTSDGGPYGGTCSITAGGVATLDNTGGDPDGEYSGVYFEESSLTGKLLADAKKLEFRYTGTPTNGSPRISLPLDTDGDGATDVYAFISPYWCNDGMGRLDATDDPTCRIFVAPDITGNENWAALVAAYPTATIGPDGALPFIIADEVGLWTVSKVSLGEKPKKAKKEKKPKKDQLLCFDGTTDGGPYGGDCSVTTSGVATLDNTGGDPDGEYSGVYFEESPLNGKRLSKAKELGFDYTGIPGAGAPRISLPLDTDGDGATDAYAFIAAYYCNDGMGHLDAINDATCTIFVGVDPTAYPNWAAVVSAYPTATIGPDGNVPFVIADEVGVWTVSKVALGKKAKK